MKSIFTVLQKMGKALMLPIAVLPIAGILMRIGQYVKKDFYKNIKIFFY